MSELSEEEKKAIEKIELLIQYFNKWEQAYTIIPKDKKYFETLLNLIENQQKELNNIKEIEKSHKEENGKLRVKLTKQEKMIELMVEKYNDDFGDIGDFCQHEYCSKDYNCKECIKQYFEKKAEESE